ncbi:uncharacterized protein LOC128739368 [Sabethes cyaneus]|uniref:uncharacterized protein LOC128739368 n=1 Tax=Sabethes cyaneus TaxID=53552 RepID=UPI00237E6072|nr:uncharacterized protein LOC128739368 [Sabethes cyaneus]
MENVCEQCAKPVQADGDHVKCMGFCDQLVHAKCAKMNAAFLKVLRERKNLLWMCDECVKLIKMTRFKGVMSSVSCAVSSIASSHGEAVGELKQAILVNGQRIEQLSKSVSEAATTPLTSRYATAEPPKKRRREERIMGSKPLLAGTKSSTSQTVLTVSPPKKLFWLYLSRIRPTVKPEAILELVQDCLQSSGDPIKVIPLIKKDADLYAMNYISFKVGMDEKYRDIALDTGTWPHGLLFREFEGTSVKNYWAPSISRVSPSTPRIEITPASNPPSSIIDPGPLEIGS